MNLYFMRHGIAEAYKDAGGPSADRERRLTPKGIKRTKKAAKGFTALSLTFDRILTSPLERARETAKIVAETLQLEERIEEIEQLAPDRSVEDLLAALAAYAGNKDILLVGHEPLLSSAVSFLVSGKVGAEIRLKKGGLCCLEVDGVPAGQRALLHWLLTPKQLRLMAR